MKKEEDLSFCVKNVVLKNEICEEYCLKKCKTCNQTKEDCIACAEFYEKNEKGECEIESGWFEIMTKVRPFLAFITRKGFKAFFFIINDLWLYDYHEREYDGILKEIFKAISFVEEKQWEIVGLGE